METPSLNQLLPEISFKTSRSGGAGGQNVNKVSTKVELLFHVQNSSVLTEEQKELMTQKLANKISNEGFLQIISQTERTQLRNKKIALNKFEQLINEAFFIPKKRKKSEVPFFVKEKRLQEKKRNAQIKAWRKP